MIHFGWITTESRICPARQECGARWKPTEFTTTTSMHGHDRWVQMRQQQNIPKCGPAAPSHRHANGRFAKFRPRKRRAGTIIGIICIILYYVWPFSYPPFISQFAKHAMAAPTMKITDRSSEYQVDPPFFRIRFEIHLPDIQLYQIWPIHHVHQITLAPSLIYEN